MNRFTPGAKGILLPVLTALFILILPVTAGEVDDVIKNMQKKYRDTNTIRIDFSETSSFNLTGVENRISGKLLMQGKNRFRLESDDQILVNDGETFWRYSRLEGQVLIDYAKKDDQELLLNDFLYDLKDKYFSTLLEKSEMAGKKVFVIKLTPRPEEQSYFTEVKMWVQDKSWLLQRLVYTDYNDNKTEYTIEKMEFNPELTTTVFTFTPPEGAEVVDLRM